MIIFYYTVVITWLVLSINDATIETDVSVAWSPSVTLTHPANTVVWNEVLFGTDTYWVPGNSVLDGWVPVSSQESVIGVLAQVRICIAS